MKFKCESRESLIVTLNLAMAVLVFLARSAEARLVSGREKTQTTSSVLEPPLPTANDT